MRKVISVIQEKGGVGKSTVAVNLAVALRDLRPDLTIAVADADHPQQSAVKWLRRGSESISAHSVAIDRDGRTLKDELDQIKADILILDLPPKIEALAMRAALYSDLVLVPIGASALEIEAAKDVVNLCAEVSTRKPGDWVRIVPTRIKLGTTAAKDFLEAIPAWGKVTRATLCHRIAYSDSATAGLGVSTYAPGSDAHDEVVELGKEVLEILEGGDHEQQIA